MERAGRKVVLNELQGAALEAAKVQIAVMRGEVEGVKACDRTKAAKEILDRAYGTAPQTVLHGKANLDELSDGELLAIATGRNN